MRHFEFTFAFAFEIAFALESAAPSMTPSENPKQTPSATPRTGWRNALLALALMGVSVVLVCVLVEGLLRFVPGVLPSGSYGSGSYDPELQMNTHGGQMLYNKGRLVKKMPNRAGFMDVAHGREKPAGTLRVGIFGDSYVEALQVPTEEAFFRRLPERIGETPLEPLAFGMSGWGTLHSLVTARVQAPRYDLDTVVYVFVENDPGDNSYPIQKALGHVSSPKPFADFEPADEGFEIVWLSPPGPPSPARRIAKFVQGRSLLAQLVWHRIYMLRNQGIATRRKDDAEAMTERASNERPSPNALPSSWLPSLRTHAEGLGERLLAAFAAEMAAEGRHFVVLYVPRGETQLRGELDLADTWRPWLGRACAKLGIPLIDPSDALRARLERGDAVYSDHWSPAGHEVIAGEIADYLRRRRS